MEQSFIEKMSVLFVKQRIIVSEPPIRGHRGTVLCDSSLARWTARSRLHIGYNWIFLLALMAEALTSEHTSKSAFLEEGGSVRG